MFDVPLDNRMEYVHTRDVGLAFANALSRQGVWRKILLIGGGPRCQYTYREITERVLDGMGIGMLPEEAFASIPFPTDWLDTDESQKLLQYQRLTLEDYVHDMRSRLSLRLPVIRAARPLVRYVLLSQSPHLYTERSGWLPVLMHKIKMLKSPPRAEMG